MIYTLYYARKEKPEKARMNLIKTQQLYQPSLGKFHVTDLCHFVTFPGKISKKNSRVQIMSRVWAASYFLTSSLTSSLRLYLDILKKYIHDTKFIVLFSLSYIRVFVVSC